jgi:O-antigen ligase
VERGLLGLAGLLALYAVLLYRAVGLMVAGIWRGIGMAGLGAAAVANAVDSFFHEILHFRHAVVLFALVWVASELVRPGPPAPAAVEPRHAAA